MVSALKRIVAVMLFLSPTVAWALGVAGIDVSSGLNQPFNAKIPIVAAKPGELADMKVTLAEKDIFDSADLARPRALTSMKFEVVATGDGDGSGYIHITSRDRIREPALEFIIEVKWRNGSLRRKYSVLLDPR
jgi:pilus assembly protein FimV